MRLLGSARGLGSAGGFAQPTRLVAGRQCCFLLAKRVGLGVECFQPRLGRTLVDCLICATGGLVAPCQPLALEFVCAARLIPTLTIGYVAAALRAQFRLRALAGNLILTLLEPGIGLLGFLLSLASRACARSRSFRAARRV